MDPETRIEYLQNTIDTAQDEIDELRKRKTWTVGIDSTVCIEDSTGSMNEDDVVEEGFYAFRRMMEASESNLHLLLDWNIEEGE